MAPPKSRDGKHGGASAQAKALEQLRMDILRGRLAPGQRLVESDIAERLEVTRGAVRLALLTLTDEGLVERIPHRGASVRQVPLEEALEITDVRMVLEGLCAGKAAEQVTGQQADQLRAIGEEMQQVVAGGDLLRYSDLNRTLHGMIRDMAHHDVASQIIKRLRGQSGVSHQFRLALQPGRPQVSLGEHLAIIDAVVARDPEGAEAAMRRHLSSVRVALQDAADNPVPAVGLLAEGLTGR